MEKISINEALQMMITIVDRGKGVKIVDLYRSEHLHFNFTCLGLGTANSEILDYFGLSETEKDVVITMIPGLKIPGVIDKANQKLKLAKPGNGIIFTVSLSGVSGPVQKVLCKPEYFEGENGGRKMENQVQCDLILTVLNRGFTDKVMDAAKKAGARGGTVLYARRVGYEDAENFLGFTIQPEKEIIAIIAPRHLKLPIMQEINKSAGITTECHGILFSMAINDIMGINFEPEAV